MCYHAQQDFNWTDLALYYKLVNSKPTTSIKRENDIWNYHNNGYDHNVSPVVVAPDSVGLYSWGLIPWYTKDLNQALMIRNQTLNAISEEMYDKPSYRDSLKDGKRCLVPVSGFFEWRWLDTKGKEKQPYFIHLKDQKIFSLAGLWSSWEDKANDKTVYTYSVLTTKANPLMEHVHNNKKRMPVIIPKEYENDWLNPSLTREDVSAFCKPFDEAKMEAYTISKLITSKGKNTNVPEVSKRVEVPPITKTEQGSLF